MKKLLYVLIVFIGLSTVFLILTTNNKNVSYKAASCDEAIYCLGELCLDLKSEHYDFVIHDYSHSLFLSKTSKEIKMDNDSILVYIYPNMESMDADSRRLIAYQHELEGLLYDKARFSLFYKKDRLIVQYSGNNQTIKKSLDSILGLSFLEFS